MASDEGEVAPPPPKKQKTSYERTVTKGAERSVMEALAPPEDPLAPPPLKRVLRKRRTVLRMLLLHLRLPKIM
jgi:hypothetical protein